MTHYGGERNNSGLTTMHYGGENTAFLPAEMQKKACSYKSYYCNQREDSRQSRNFENSKKFKNWMKSPTFTLKALSYPFRLCFTSTKLCQCKDPKKRKFVWVLRALYSLVVALHTTTRWNGETFACQARSKTLSSICFLLASSLAWFWKSTLPRRRMIPWASPLRTRILTSWKGHIRSMVRNDFFFKTYI